VTNICVIVPANTVTRVKCSNDASDTSKFRAVSLAMFLYLIIVLPSDCYPCKFILTLWCTWWIRMTFMMKSRVDWIQEMLAIIQSKIFCLPVSYQKNLKIKIYKTVILTVVLYVFEAWSLALREEHWPRVPENRVLRRIFEPKREEEGSWRILHNDELHNL
jgi:hypothetical protein